jgi:hypothetical protein
MPKKKKEIYGKSPIYLALEDLKKINKILKLTLLTDINGEKKLKGGWMCLNKKSIKKGD